MFSQRQPVYFTIALALAACSKNEANSLASSPAAALTYSSQNLYASFSQIPKTTLAANFSSIGKMNFDQFFGFLTTITSNQKVVIDGHTFLNQLDQLQANKSAIIALGSSYQQVSDYWKALGVTSAVVDQNTFISGLKGLESADSAQQPSLGLDDDWANYVAPDPNSDKCQTVETEAGTGDLTSVSAAMVSATNEAIHSVVNESATSAETSAAYTVADSTTNATISATAKNYNPGGADTPAPYIAAWHAYANGSEDKALESALGGRGKQTDCFKKKRT